MNMYCVSNKETRQLKNYMRSGSNISTLHEIIIYLSVFNVIFTALSEISCLVSLAFSMLVCDDKVLIVCCAKSDSYCRVI